MSVKAETTAKVTEHLSVSDVIDDVEDSGWTLRGSVQSEKSAELYWKVCLVYGYGRLMF